GPGLRTTGPPGRLTGPVAGGMARGCRGTNSIARRSTSCQAASVRGQSNQMLSGVLRAGRASTAGLSPLSTPSSILICNVKLYIIVLLLREPLHALRMRVERTFAWEDKFKRLLLRFERIQHRHYGMKLLAYTLINLRKFCGT